MTYRDKCREEFAEFAASVVYEGGVEDLLIARGLDAFPRQLRPSARLFQQAILKMESDINTYGQAIGFVDMYDALNLLESGKING